MGRTLNLAMVGLGGAARQMMPSLLSHPHVRVTHAADPRPEARNDFETKYGGKAFAHPADLVACPDVDIVYIATPHQMHRDHVCLAARAGKHVIIEKPMALSLEDCEVMIDVAEREGIHLLVGHTHSFNSPIVKMRALIRDGTIGPVAMINSWNYGAFLYRPRRPEELRTELGGGIIYNQVPHQVDVVRYLGGGLVRSVRSQVFVLDPDRPTEGAHTTFLQFEDGAAATLSYSGYDFFDSDEFHFWIGELGDPRAADTNGSSRRALSTIAGTQRESELKSATGFGGSKPLPAADPKTWGHPHFGVTIVTGSRGDLRQSARGVYVYDAGGRREVALNPPRAYPDKCGVIDEMYDAIAGNRPLVHDGRWGMATMEVCQAILQSAREGCEVFLSRQVKVAD